MRCLPACSAPPLSCFLIYPNIFTFQWMTTIAVCFSSVDRSLRIPSHHVFNVRHGLKMRRIHAQRISAQVVQHEVARNLPNQLLVRNSMRLILPSFYVEDAISGTTFYFVICANPIPASIDFGTLNFTPEFYRLFDG